MPLFYHTTPCIRYKYVRSSRWNRLTFTKFTTLLNVITDAGCMTFTRSHFEFRRTKERHGWFENNKSQQTKGNRTQDSKEQSAAQSDTQMIWIPFGDHPSTLEQHGQYSHGTCARTTRAHIEKRRTESGAGGSRTGRTPPSATSTSGARAPPCNTMLITRYHAVAGQLS